MRALLFLILLTFGTAAPAQWYEATTPRVRVYAGGAEQARRIAERLERLDAAMRLMRRMEVRDLGPASRLTVYMVKSANRIAAMSRRNAAGFYSARAGGSVAYVPSAGAAAGSDLSSEAVLFHEYAHHFLYRNAPGAYPGWFSEGFAEFHATAKLSADGSVMFGLAPAYRAYGIIMGTQLPIERLLEPGTTRMTGEQLDNLYGRGWMLTHLLTFDKERRGQLARYMKALRDGQPSVEAARAAFGDLAVLDRELNRYASRRLTGLQVRTDSVKLPEIAIRQLPPAEAAIMDVHIESTSGVDTAQANRLLPRARRLAAPHSGNAFVQGVLAEAEFDAGNHAESRDAALRALTADAKSRQGLIYHGMALAALAEKAGDRTPATYRAVIAPWQRANRLDPDDPRPMMLIYEAANAFGQRSPAIVKAIKYAQAIAPEDDGLRAIAAHEYLQDGETRPARTLIASLAYDPHAGNREKMAAVLALIDANDAKGAMAALARDPGAKDTGKGTATGDGKVSPSGDKSGGASGPGAGGA